MNRPTPVLLAFVLLSASLAGCPSAGDDLLPSCTAPDDLALNTVSAQVEGDAWIGATAGFQIVAAGPAMQVSATGQDDDGDTVNVVLRLLRSSVHSVAEDGETVEVDEGVAIEEALSAQETPYDFVLGDANDEGANATVTTSGPSMSTGEGDAEGFLRFTSVGVPADADEGAPEEVVGCFNLTAVSQDGSNTVSITDGAFRLTEL
ncbi:MAG: hypothetical protein KDA24_09585 [Deltaproteobacteria bacterium]|nr:hypothetical protein [Deltaproteobacteria bacterium]